MLWVNPRIIMLNWKARLRGKYVRELIKVSHNKTKEIGSRLIKPISNHIVT